MRNQTKKVIAKPMKTKAEKEMEELREKPNKIFKFVKSMKRDEKDVDGRKWIKGRDGRIGFSQEDRCKIWNIDVKHKREGLQKLCTISYVVWK